MTPGTYILLLRLTRVTTISVGRLGRLQFKPGYYGYAGSALNGLEGRIGRHLKVGKAKRWHVDYLRDVATVEGVRVLPGRERGECSLVAELLRLPGGRPGPAGFGSSDCRCQTHLVHFDGPPAIGHIGREWSLNPSLV